MEKILTSIKNRIAWVEKEKDNLTNNEQKFIAGNLKAIDDELARCMLLHMAINK